MYDSQGRHVCLTSLGNPKGTEWRTLNSYRKKPLVTTADSTQQVWLVAGSSQLRPFSGSRVWPRPVCAFQPATLLCRTRHMDN